MLSLNEPSALLSNARLTIATLIQRPSTITTSNAFDEFSILDDLIDVSNDVERFEDGENRKFLNIAQVITASTCIYSRRVDALYKLINTFQSSSTSLAEIKDDESETEEILNQKEAEEEEKPKKILQEKKKKSKQTDRTFLCNDLTKINLNTSKTFFLDRTSLYDLKLFQKFVPLENKQFWLNDNRPIIFNLLYHDQQLNEIQQDDNQQPQQIIDVTINPSSDLQLQPIFNDNDIPLPIFDNDDKQQPLWNTNGNNMIIEKKKSTRNRTKKIKQDLDLNIFRHGLTTQQQALFRFQKFKPISNKMKSEPIQFFNKKFTRKQFDALIKDSPASIISIFIYPTITIHHFTIREQYSTKIDRYRSIPSPSVPIGNIIHNDNDSFLPLNDNHDDNDDIQEDADIRLQTDMEQILDAAILNSNDEQQHNKIFLELRSLIMTYMTEHQTLKQINVDDLFEYLHDNYSLPLIFSQLLHLCASTQRYSLHSTADDQLYIVKVI